jgi:hypothetical protein
MSDLLKTSKESVASEQFQLGTDAFNCEEWSEAVKHYREAGKTYAAINMRELALMAYYQAITVRRRQYPAFLKEGNEDFLRPDYFKELEEFVAGFEEFEREEQKFRERYVKTKYAYLQARGFKSDQEHDFDASAMTLEDLAALLQRHSDIFTGDLYQVEKVFTFRLMAEQRKLRLLRGRSPTLQSLAAEYKRVADMGFPPESAASPFLEEAKAQQANFYAESLKFSAFSSVEKRRPNIFDVKRAMELMKQALEQAREAKDWFDQIDKAKGFSYEENLRYLSYWHNIFRLRVCLVDREFDQAKAALDDALADARYYKDLERENDIFPNYYADYDDLRNEGLFISAAQALIDVHDPGKSRDFLKEWMDCSKERHLGSWRFNNVSVRHLVVSVLTLLPSVRQNLQTCKDKIAIIDEILVHEFVGSASRNLVTVFKQMVEMVGSGVIELHDNVYEALFLKICELFPVDATSRDFKLVESRREVIAPLDYLPEYFSQCFKMPQALGALSSDQVKEICETLKEGLRYYLCLIVEFHYKRYLGFQQQRVAWLRPLPDHFDEDFSRMNLNELKISLAEICGGLGERRLQAFSWSFSDVEELDNILKRTLPPPVAMLELFQVVVTRLISKSYMRFFPHVIQVTGSYVTNDNDKEEAKIYKAKRIWKKGIPEELRLIGSGLKLEDGKYYYLTPRWKRYGRENVDTRSGQFAIFESRLYPVTVEEALAKYRSNLKEKLSGCPAGPPGWRDYEDICIEILKFLFVPPLTLPDIQSRTEGGLLRRDALFPNWVEQGFWASIGQRHDANFILFEFKNTEDLEPIHLDQVHKYLSQGKETIGRFGVILSRKAPSSAALKTRKAWFSSGREVILFLDDRLLVKALELREAGGDPVEVLRAEYETFLKSYEP